MERPVQMTSVARGVLPRWTFLTVTNAITFGCGGRTDLYEFAVERAGPSAQDAGVSDVYIRDAGQTVPVIALDAGSDSAVPEPVGSDAAKTPDASVVCSVQLTVWNVSPSPSTCWIDEKVSNRTARLDYACSGGTASIDFAVTFTGTVFGTDAQLDATTQFAWGDGCTWQSEQTIFGDLSSGALEYKDREHPIKGTNCAASNCTALVPVIVNGWNQ